MSQGSHWAEENGWRQHCSRWLRLPASRSWRLSQEWSGQRLIRSACSFCCLQTTCLTLHDSGKRGRSNTRTISVSRCFLPLPASLSRLWSSEKSPSSFGQLKPGKGTQSLSPTLFCCEKMKEAQWMLKVMERMLTPAGNSLLQSTLRGDTLKHLV